MSGGVGLVILLLGTGHYAPLAVLKNIPAAGACVFMQTARYKFHCTPEVLRYDWVIVVGVQFFRGTPSIRNP